MDMKETSAMTEASGIVGDGAEPASAARPTDAIDERPLRFDSRQVGAKLLERLRQATVRAPLQPIFAAFVLGVWIARRR